MQEQKQRQTRPKCLVKDCIAKACPSGTGYCSRHDWERTPLGARPTKGTVGALASQSLSINTEKQNQSVAAPIKPNAKTCSGCGKPWHPFEECEDEPSWEKAKAAVAGDLDALVNEL
jgi:hypothetical protein